MRSGPGEERAAFFDKVAAAADEAKFAEGSANEQRTVADWADRRAERLVLRAARSALSLGYAVTGGYCTGVPVYRYRYTGIPATKTSEGSFSAVSKPIFATRITRGSFCSIFQDL